MAVAPKSFLAFAVSAAFLLISACGEDDQAAPAPISTATPSPAATGGTAYGFVRFPFDLSAASLNQVDAIVNPISDFTAIHLDLVDCIPWEQMLAGEAIPEWLAADFSDQVARIPANQFTTLAVTPTAQNRTSLAAQCGDQEGEFKSIPPQILNAGLDDPSVIAAFSRYVEETIHIFNPSYLILGIEISELSLKEPARWDEFEALYSQVQQRVKRDNPSLPVGPEMVLQTIMLDRVGTQVRPLVESADFLALSFYPFTSPIGAAQGAPALPDPPSQWLEPFQFLRTYTSKPIAFAETGYTSRDFRLETNGIQAFGTEELQTQFVRDLAAEAKERDWLFVVWFFPIDYTPLIDATQPTGSALDLLRIWEFTGLYRSDLTSKPALDEWIKAQQD